MYAWLLPAYVLFVWYGSLVPLNFSPIPFDEAVRRFREAPYITMGVAERTDFIANILLFVPVAYFLLAALRTDRRSRILDVLVGLAVLPLFTGLSMAIEFTEMYFPGRTLSFNDVLAQTLGGVIGTGSWISVGRAITAWMREVAAERERTALVAQLLLAYVVLFTIAQLAPLNLTLNLSELAAKFRQGRIILIPFSFEYASWTAMAWDHLWDVMLNVPLGAAATLVGMSAGRRRAPAQALALGVLAVGAIECGQVFVNSRFADVTDVLKGALGVAIGIAATSRLSLEGPEVSERGLDRAALVARLGLVAWIIALIGYHWNPFEFTFDRERVALGLRAISAVPLTHHYWSQEFHAFTEMLRKALLALPLGALLYPAWPDRGRSYVPRLRTTLAVVGGFGLLFVIELGQVFLPGRLPDITDVMIGDIGIMIGLWLAARLARASAPSVRAPVGA